MTAKFSIIIPTYNRECVIHETIQSVLHQSFCDFECIVVDDNSNDHTAGIISEYQDADPRILLVSNTENKGACFSRNRGLDLAKGEFICFLDSDDLLHPNYLEKQYYSLEQTPDAGVSVCKSLYFRVSPHESTSFSRNLDYPITLSRYLSGEITWVTSCSLWRSDAIRSLKGFSQKLAMCQDWELNARYLTLGGTVAITHDCLVYYRYQWDQNQISSGIHNDQKHILNFYRSRQLVLLTHFNNRKFISPEIRNILASNFANLPGKLLEMHFYKEFLAALFCSLYLERHPRPLKSIVIQLVDSLKNKCQYIFIKFKIRK